MDNIEHILLGVVTTALGVVVRLYVAARKRLAAPERLEQHAERGCDYAEQLASKSKMTSGDKLRHALEASIKLDRDANGRQDWSDAQHRIAIEAALAKRTRTVGKVSSTS